ncbi:hypothetical protein [Burkholderia multivorans]|uniref:hypothetical protein n=1 Tax=Burkholderia multivorans TaxID=87883 RepID=UPI0009E0DE6D|nr:hypothetical protein [Burkholderia multivorans]SAK33250.1 hypothetical protein UA11_01907 [Burkholderia multivorans]
MSDLELLKLSAKAAELELEESIYPGWFMCSGRQWNPLVDDGDALRLAVKLKMDVTVGQSVKVVCATNEGIVARFVLPLEDGDDFAVVRRAIVNAAAEVCQGK